MYTLTLDIPEFFQDFVVDEIQKDVENTNKNSSTSQIKVSCNYYSGGLRSSLKVNLFSITQDPMLLPLIGWLEEFYNAHLTWTNRKEVKLND